MTITPDELLQRLSSTLRSDIGPAIADDYVKTQAFMASTILERLSRQVALAPEHDVAERLDVAELLDVLRPLLDPGPPAVAEAVARAAGVATVHSLGDVIDALYAWGADEPTVVEGLALIRAVLRRDIDRRMAVAG